MNLADAFNEYREKMNEQILSSNNKFIKRIFNLDTNAFPDGSVPLKQKK